MTPTILLVDDNEANMMLLHELLEFEYDVIPALEGEFALQVAAEDRPNLILLDLIMPGMDGFEVCKRLKENPHTSAIPVVFLTGMTDDETLEKAYDLGASDFIYKPIDPEKLFTCIRKHIA